MSPQGQGKAAVVPQRIMARDPNLNLQLLTGMRHRLSLKPIRRSLQTDWRRWLNLSVL